MKSHAVFLDIQHWIPFLSFILWLVAPKNNSFLPLWIKHCLCIQASAKFLYLHFSCMWASDFVTLRHSPSHGAVHSHHNVKGARDQCVGRVSAFTVVLVTSCAALSYIPNSLLVILVLRSGFALTHHLSSDLLFLQTLSCVSLRKSPFSSLWWQDTCFQNCSKCSNNSHLYQTTLPDTAFMMPHLPSQFPSI